MMTKYPATLTMTNLIRSPTLHSRRIFSKLPRKISKRFLISRKRRNVKWCVQTRM